MIQPAQEPIETTRDLASMAESLNIEQSTPVKHILTNDEKFEIIKNVCLIHFNLNWEDVNADTRLREIAMTRQFIMNLSTVHTTMTLKKIGSKFTGGKNGAKDHSTVIHARDTIFDLCDVNARVKEDYLCLNNAISELLKTR